jgi:hypothetical protein
VSTLTELPVLRGVPNPVGEVACRTCQELVRLMHSRPVLRDVALGGVIDECVRWNV